jgi:hypothetical protein
MAVDETIETPEGEIGLELNFAEELMIQLQMPNGVADRCDNGSVESRDIEWMNMIASMATDLENPTNIPNKTAIYIVDCVARSMEDMEIQTYDEFIVSDEGTNFISEGTLGVNND